MILGDAEHQEIFRQLPIGLTELPETATDGIEPGGGHVHRAHAAVGGIVRGAELFRPPAGQRLALVASGEKRQPARIVGTDIAEPLAGDGEGFVPADFLELRRAARTDPPQGLRQLGRRIMLHDPGRTLGAQRTLVHRVVAVALDIANRTVQQVHLDAALAGAHVAGGEFDLIVDSGRGVDLLRGGAEKLACHETPCPARLKVT